MYRGLAGLVAAAGLSLRMHCFKPLLPVGGGTVLERAVQLFRSAGIEDVRVIAGYRAAELIPLLDRLSVKVIINYGYQEGMFSSVATGVSSLGPGIRGFFLLPIDIPLVKQSTVEKLADAFCKTGKGIIYPTFSGKRGHPPLISAQYARDILTWKQPGGLKALLRQFEGEALEVQVNDQGILMDMDTPEDYSRLLQYYQGEFWGG